MALTPTIALWDWDKTNAPATIKNYSSGKPTKTGLMPADMKQFVGVPIQIYGNPPVLVPDQTIMQWIRWAEDWVEQQTNLLLCQTWVAGPPAVTIAAAQAIQIQTATPAGYQIQGYDYDLEDAAYDFFFPRAQDEGWMNYSLRYRPVRSIAYDPLTPTAIKNIAYIYPLLNEFFNVPRSWIVEDHDAGLVRLVPAQNVQMLPLFAMQLAFMGFAESVPGGIWFQYTAGLTNTDYSTRFSFIKQLVLATAAMTGLAICQGSINLGAEQTTMNIDGVMYQTKYPKEGPYRGLISTYNKMAEKLMAAAKDKVSGPMITML